MVGKAMSVGDTEAKIRTNGKIKRENIKLEFSKKFLDDFYIPMVRLLDSLDPTSDEYKRTYVKVFILATLVQNDDYWYNVRDFMEGLKLPTKGMESNRWRIYISMFLYRLYKKGFLERRLYTNGVGVGYEYRVRMERVRNPEVFFYLSYEDLVRERLV
jgi:hypothetical protein